MTTEPTGFYILVRLFIGPVFFFQAILFLYLSLEMVLNYFSALSFRVPNARGVAASYIKNTLNR